MKERLRFFQEELMKREAEIVNLTAVAAEAAAAVKQNRSLRDELDLTREQLDVARFESFLSTFFFQSSEKKRETERGNARRTFQQQGNFCIEGTAEIGAG
jgi:hypothetical protein